MIEWAVALLATSHLALVIAFIAHLRAPRPR